MSCFYARSHLCEERMYLTRGCVVREEVFENAGVVVGLGRGGARMLPSDEPLSHARITLMGGKNSLADFVFVRSAPLESPRLFRS